MLSKKQLVARVHKGQPLTRRDFDYTLDMLAVATPCMTRLEILRPKILAKIVQEVYRIKFCIIPGLECTLHT